MCASNSLIYLPVATYEYGSNWAARHLQISNKIHTQRRMLFQQVRHTGYYQGRHCGKRALVLEISLGVVPKAIRILL